MFPITFTIELKIPVLVFCYKNSIEYGKVLVYFTKKGFKPQLIVGRGPQKNLWAGCFLYRHVCQSGG